MKPTNKQFEEEIEKFRIRFDPHLADGNLHWKVRQAIEQWIVSALKSKEEQVRKEVVKKIDSFIQYPPVTRGDACVCFDLDEWEALKVDLTEREK